MWKSASTSAVHWLVGQLSEVKNWATSGAQLGIVVLQVCITPTKSYQIREHYPELLASAREFYIRDQPKFLTDTLKILPGILLLLPQKTKSTLHGQTSNRPHPTEPQWEMKTSESISFWPISPQSSQERLKDKNCYNMLHPLFVHRGACSAVQTLCQTSPSG